MLRKVPRLFLPRFLQNLQDRQSQPDHRAELLDLSQRHRMAGVLGRGDGEPRRVAGQRYQRARTGPGLRYQALLIMEPYWVQQKLEMPEPRFNAQALGDYISR